MSAFPDNVRGAWHMVALARDIRQGTLRKVMVCGTPLALFRTADGPAALVDRCPHRNYPLSEGRIVDGTLECGYHGWRFDPNGHCITVPGCELDRCGDARLDAQPVRLAERQGAIFVTLSEDAPPEPPLPLDFGNPDLDHFWWQQGTWEGRAFDAVENVMDPFHTNHLHHGFIRRRDKRLPVDLIVTSHGDGIDMAIEQTRPDLGLMSRFLEKDRQRSVSRYYPPTIVQARWEGAKELTLCVTAIFTPATAGSFTPFARFSTPKGMAPGWLKQAAIRMFLRPVVAQDRAALAKQHGVMQQFGHPQFVSGPGDILGSRLHQLWKGEQLATGADAPVRAEL